MKASERAAQTIIQRMIPGAVMHHQHDQSHGEHDFDLRLPDGYGVPVEVTEVTDSVLRQMEAARRQNWFIDRTPASRCRFDWWIHPAKGANIKRIVRDADAYLAAVEAEGLNRYFAYTDARRSPAVMKALVDLHIEEAEVTRWKRPGISIAAPIQGGRLGTDDLTAAIEHEAWKDDNRRKLSIATPERHLFVWVDTSCLLCWVGLGEHEPPDLPLRLPPEVTHVWAATRARSSNHYIVWRADRDSWFSADIISADQDGDAAVADTR